MLVPGQNPHLGGLACTSGMPFMGLPCFQASNAPRDLSCTSGMFLMDSPYLRSMDSPGQHHKSITHTTQLLPVGKGVQNPDVNGSVFQVHTPIRILGHSEAWGWRLTWESPMGWEQSGLVAGLPGVRCQLCPDEGPLVFTSRRQVVPHIL